ncbi:GatB/YqeY domain-containing protein [Sandaracinobacteroides saxicola]|uniref:GatB/YqeY domain-containing protein n=1 Tax=Sandaracinobacteroides saxicola TaxID=2759707 RepID=A0A7G5IDU6_9SPHN|nr:GatB/YqeY domain-containing protein [Sandaracinobacteroides saxicola]QMW21538.1 GatB/YqeY domain-containing protein [Sandaracinobacteroides saxicola]
MIRETIKTDLIAAMKAKDAPRVAAIRLIQSAIKNRDIELRTGTPPADDDVTVSEVLMKMAKQRRESIEIFTTGNRPELAAVEAAELAVIEGFLPQQMDEAAAKTAIETIVADLGATSVKDMGRVMAEVKSRLAGQLDMGKASAMVKAALA